MTYSKVLFFLCLSFIFGIGFESLIKIPQIFIWGILFLSIVLFFFKRMGVVLGFCLIFLIFGILRLQIAEFNITNNKLAKFNNKGEVSFIGIINNEPDVKDASQSLKIKVGESLVLVTTNRYPEYRYLDKVKITGKLETPSVTDDFNYKNYLLKDGVYSVVAFPKMEVLGKASEGLSTTVYGWILQIKQALRDSIKKIFLPPKSSILLGTIVGDNGAMSTDLKSKLNITGLRHIIAVSGTHIVILSIILMPIFLSFGLWRKQAIVLSIGVVWGCIILTGLSASGVRAGVMGSILFLSQIFGRQNASYRTMALAGSLMLFQNPLLLFYDAGFQLSFLASMGIIYLNPIFLYFLKFIFKDNFKELVSIIPTTFSAQIFTLPLMLFNFGNISLVAPITNLLILPIVEPLMIFGFIFAFVGMFSSWLGFVFSLPCQVLLMYFKKVIDVFSQPYMAIFLKNVPWVWLIILYLIIGIITRYLSKKYLSEFL